MAARNAHKVPHSEKIFPRLKVRAYRMNEIWLTDVDYMDKIAKYENGVKYLLIAGTVLSRFLTELQQIQLVLSGE